VSYLRKNIDAMAGYTPGEQPAPGTRVVKLNTNENPYPPSPRVVETLRSLDAASLRLYPDPMADRVREVVARLHGVRPEQVLCGNGSDELLSLAFRAFVGERQRVVWPSPTYSLYPVLAEVQGAEPIEIPTADDFTVPVDVLAAAPARLLLFCNPNAPTGTWTSTDTVGRIADRFDGVVVVDEAYVDFACGNALDLVRGTGPAGQGARPNVLVFRTLSKSYSLAGLRFGYAVGSVDLIAGLAKVKDSYNVDAVSIALAAAALEDQDHMRANVERVRAERSRLAAGLAALGLTVYPSEANFLLAGVPDGRGQAWHDGLKGRGILVRYWNLPRLADKLRITVGAPEENDALLAAVERMRKESF